MEVSSPFPHVASPLWLGGCQVRNRIARTAHATGLPRGTVNDRLIAYHAARARGGVGLLIAEIASVHDSSPGPIEAQRDEVIPGLARLAEAVHQHGAAVFQQLWHGGAHGLGRHHVPAWAPSAVPSVSTGRLPLEMTQAMIDDVIEGYASAAARCAEAGLDGVEIHGAHGYLIGQFLSPLTNRRDDDYGGDLTNRARFLLEVMTAVRSAVPDGFTVGLRLAGSEGIEGGSMPDEIAQVAAMVDAAGLIDVLDVSLGSYYAFEKMIGPMHEPLAYELPANRPVLDAVSVPTIVTGRIMDLHDAEQIIATGQASMVSMVRATIADPNLVAKSLAGRVDQVRPCLACNQGCVGGLYGPAGRIGCTVNPDVATPADGIDLTPAPARRRVVIIGGGPAGLEAAHTAATRGHQVDLYEARAHLGGLTHLARRAPHRQDIAAHSDWVATELGRLGVAVHLDTLLGPDELAGLGADVVILATGADPRLTGPQRDNPQIEITGLGAPHVLTPDDVLSGGAPRTGRVVVFDDIGHVVAASAAEHVVENGGDVTFLTSHLSFTPELDRTLQREPLQRRLAATRRFTLRALRALVAVDDGAVVARDLTTGLDERYPADWVIVDLGRSPRRDLLAAAEATGAEVHVVGDASDPRDIQVAVATGRRAGLTI